MSDPTSLLEGFGYTQLFGAIDWDYIKMAQHYKAIESMGVRYESTQFDMVRFSSPSESRPGMRHRQWVQMAELRDVINDPNYNISDKVRMGMMGDLKVHCSCEASQFFYNFILTSLDAAIVPEERPPNIRNPARRGTVCKHLGVVLKVFPFWWNTIAGELTRQGYGQPPGTVPAQPPTEQPPAEPAQEPQVAPGTQAAPAGWAARRYWQQAARPRGPGESLEPSFAEIVEDYLSGLKRPA